MLARIWSENRQFLLITGTALALFLTLNSCVSSCGRKVDGPKGLYAEASRLEKDIRRLHKSLSQYSSIQTYLEGYEKEEVALRADLEIPPEPEIQSFDAAAPLLQFEKAIDRVWNQALAKANRGNLALPEKPASQDFDVGRQDGKAEYEEHYRKLAVLRRALDALLDAEMSQVGRPVVVDPEELPVLPDDDSVRCLFQGIEFRTEGQLASYLKLLSLLQGPRDFLQVRLASLAPRKGETGDVLEGTVQFWSFRLVEGAPAEATRKKTTRPRRW